MLLCDPPRSSTSRPGVLVPMLRATAAVALGALLVGKAPDAHAAAPKAKRADLVVRTTKAKVSAGRPGTAVTLKVTLRNGGLGAAKASMTRVSLGAGRTYADGDAVLATVRQPALKARRAAKTRTVKLKLPEASGTRTLIVCADAANAVKESDEARNCAVAGTLAYPARAAEQLIAQDLQAKRIDADQAYALTTVAQAGGSELLPARYRGATAGPPAQGATEAIFEAASRLKTLNAKAQAILAPLLAPPAHVADGAAASPAAHPRAAGGRPLSCTETAQRAQREIPDAANWSHRTSRTGVTFWWARTQANGAATASTLITELDNRIWPKLTGLMQVRPASDANMLCGSGLDNGLDVYLVDTIGGRSFKEPVNPGEMGATAPYYCGAIGNPGFIRLADQTKETLAHEFFHVLQLAFPNDCARRAWIDEGTAEWAVEYVYPKALKNTSSAWLKQWDGTPLQERSYDAWPFWYSVTRRAGADVIRKMFQSFTGRPYASLVDTAIGTFATRFGEFALDGYNFDPVVSFSDWTATTAAPVARTNVLYIGSGHERSAPYEGGRLLLPLSRDYEHVVVSDAKVRKLTFDALPATAGYGVQALIKLKGRPWSPKPVAITNGTTFCRDNPEQDVDEMVLIGTNSRIESNVQGAPQIKLQDECSLPRYKITAASFSIHTDGQTDDKVEQGCSTTVGGIKDYGGHLSGGPVVDPDNRLKRSSDGLQRGDVWTDVDSAGTIKLKGCVHPYEPEEAPCEVTREWGKVDHRDTIGFEFEISPAHPDVARLNWKVDAADFGYIDPDDSVCNVFEVFNHVPLALEVTEVPVEQLQRGTHTFTNSNAGFHFDKSAKNRQVDMTHSWSYSVTVQVIDADGNPIP